jgi:uncharacterized damage-inducible protein DinB
MEPLTNLFQHNLWANLRLLESCQQLTDEQLDKAIVGTYGSIIDTLRHIVRAEQSYFARISTGQPYQHPEGAPPMMIAELIQAASVTGQGLVEWATRVGAGDTVMLSWDGTPREVPKTTILTQVINHATEHRAQIMASMTQLGIEPPDLDSWTYFDEMDREG